MLGYLALAAPRKGDAAARSWRGRGVPKDLIREGPPSTREPGKAGAPSDEAFSWRERVLDVEDIVPFGRWAGNRKLCLLTADNLRIGRFMYTDWLVQYTPFGICVGVYFGFGRSSLW